MCSICVCASGDCSKDFLDIRLGKHQIVVMRTWSMNLKIALYLLNTKGNRHADSIAENADMCTGIEVGIVFRVKCLDARI